MRIYLNPFSVGHYFATELQTLVIATRGGLKQEVHLHLNDWAEEKKFLKVRRLMLYFRFCLTS